MSQKFLLVFIIILFFAVCGISANLISLNAKVDLLAAGNPSLAANGAPNQTQKAAAKQKKTTARELAITDQGYSPAGFQIRASETTTVKITNNGQKAHSFIVDELDLDSGIINGGQTKEIIINTDVSEAKTFPFYSNAEGDDPQTFTGILMVTK